MRKGMILFLLLIAAILICMFLILLIKGTGLSGYQRFVKRTMDIVLCLIALIPAAPIMLITALAIKLEDHGPVFYKQERVTKDMKRFC